MSQPVWSETNRSRWVGVRPAIEGEQIMVRTNVANGTATLYTVPANKILLLHSASISIRSTVVGTAIGYAIIYSNAGAVKYDLLLGSNYSIHDENLAHHFPIPMELPSSYYVNLYSAVAGISMTGSIFGTLIDA